jgi:FKBP-type peptidyl-prolyl cis-trans isomerase SlpA
MTGPGPKIVPGSRVRMHFSLALPDGTEAVSTFGEEPMELTLGDGTLGEGLELALYGLRPGAEQTLRIDGDSVYGPRDENNIHSIPLERFPAGIEPRPGLIVAFDTADGEPLPGAILELSESEARVDFNHPLAGREIVFRVEILDVTAPAGTQDA